ncbi:MAG: SDR family NAD(P)-dependent oxidoreductase [Anaerolineae bacterium]|nr:SDR family NAD(P)-dependent oxidoreductase [Anaerolineae bacterium]
MELSNRVVVITGASKGLGRATALRLSRKTPHLILIARDISMLRQVQAEIAETTGHEPVIVQCDVSSESEVERMAALVEAKYSRVDVLINNAGFGTYRVSENLSNEEMRRHFEVNFFGAYYCIKALLPLLKQSEAGYVLNVGSLFSRVALAENSVYAATKFALAGFSEGLRCELKSSGVGVGLFMPGPMNTSFQDGRDEGAIRSPIAMEPEQAAAAIEKMIAGRKKSLARPAWMLTALRLKQSFA